MITKEQIQQEAVKLGLELTEEQVAQYEKDQKLPVNDLEKADTATLISIIKDLRSENAEKRVAAKKAMDKLDEIKKNEDKAKREAQEKQGEYETLYKNTLAELEALKPIKEEFDADVANRREKCKTKLGDYWMDSFTNIKIGELEAFTEKHTPSGDSTHTGNQKPQHQQSNERKTLINYKS